MKKTATVLALAVVLSVRTASAAPHPDFSNIIQNFAQSKGMVFQGLNQTDENGRFDKDVWIYSFASSDDSDRMLIGFEYVKPGKICVMPPDLFGDLPLTISGRKALFSSASISDSRSLARDVLFVDDGQGGCYEVSYGFKGSGFDEVVRLMKQLLGQ